MFFRNPSKFLQGKDIIFGCDRMVEERREELAAGDIDVGHRLNSYHLINFWDTLMNKVKNHSNYGGK